MVAPSAQADGQSDDRAITTPGDKPPRPRLDVPVEPVQALATLRSFASAFPLGWMLYQSWATEAEPPSTPGGIVAPGERPPKGPR
jgi:hypothetical protein